jgi:hypothetical protein
LAANVRHRTRQVGDDEADARIKFSGMPLDFGNHSARLGPASRLIGEIGMQPTHLVRRSPDRAFEQVADPALENLVGRQPDRVLDPLGFQELRCAKHTCPVGEGGLHGNGHMMMLEQNSAAIAEVIADWLDQNVK